MAFDFPIEADRVDNLNLFTVFLRAPVIGTVMWLLGGGAARQLEEERLQEGEDCGGNADERPNGMPQPRLSPPPSPQRGLEIINHFDSVGSSLPMKRMPPRLIHSDISEIAETAMAAEGLALLHQCTNNQSTVEENSNKVRPPGSFRKERRMSWSDESGQNLVQYVGVESTRHEPPPSLASTSGAVKPIRSAMRRSRSTRSHASVGNEHLLIREPNKADNLRYIPNGLSEAHNGLIMPTRPHNALHPSESGNNNNPMNGAESPQWGWYINTTPPTPEMHQSPHMMKSSMKSQSTTSTDSAASSDAAATPAAAANHNSTNLVFQGLNKTAKPHMGWPSVPL